MTDQPQTMPAPEPTPEPTAEPTPEPTAAPTAEPTAESTVEPTVEPSPEPTSEPTPPRDRRVLRAVGRWVAVVGVFALLGAGTAYAIVGMERTDVPGLATESDGRWAYPEITRPPVPARSPGPLDPANWSDSHYADLRELLLPAPEGATDDKALHGTDGWLATKDFLAVFGSAEDREKAGQVLTDYGLRHVAARGWTTEDGTRTGIYLLQFDTGTVASDAFQEFSEYDSPVFNARGADVTVFDDGYPTAADVSGVERYAYDEIKPYGAEHLRQAYLCAGDVMAVITQSRKGTAAAVPFQQTVVLQSQLLG
ncbi:hypothetical protein JCM4814A_76660 [Streptomyces phaeofaciens JCM 4814]|uniref:Uncharacterized protein n=1 Tax=Streptomyces phaeofaciens TaxID=68254 RepID=A0A918HQI8_9ACTN|nr:hypothetical protein [Streptomyces phaeofaciens]GGT85638.1 hypothetical protein GCM10010226_75290 [Streptomyces phaeofaciens]